MEIGIGSPLCLAPSVSAKWEDFAGAGISGFKQSNLAADNFHARKPLREISAHEQISPADQASFQALQREMEEMAAKSKRSDRTERKEHREITGPVLVIRGK